MKRSMEQKIKYVLIFLIGFLSCTIAIYCSSFWNIEKPLNFNFNDLDLNSAGAKAPSDWIKEEQFEIKNDRIIINIKDASITKYAPTGSMKPIFDENANGIRIVPEKEEQINIGDIVSFKSGNNLVVHRVIEKGADEQGVYFITKGDNNNITDEKIRFKDIKFVTVGVIW